MKQQLLFLLLISLIFQHINAQNNTSAQIVRSTTGVSGSSETIITNNKSYIVQQSLGQASVIGTFSNVNYILRQGFIQPNVLAKIIDVSIPLNLEAIVYPNPFVEGVTLVFSETIIGKVEVTVYDMLGRFVFSKKYQAKQNLKVDFYNLSVTSYILKVTANKKQFVKIIIKK